MIDENPPDISTQSRTLMMITLREIIFVLLEMIKGVFSQKISSPLQIHSLRVWYSHLSQGAVDDLWFNDEFCG